MKKNILALFLLPCSLAAFPQSKVIIDDYNKLKKELVSIKSEGESYASDIKNTWTNDTAKIKGKAMYIQLSAAVDGVIEEFKTVIRKPRSLNSVLKEEIAADLEKLKIKLAGLSDFYINGNLAPGEPPVETSILSLFEVGKGIFDDIKKILAGEREKIAQQFESDCKLRKWDDL